MLNVSLWMKLYGVMQSEQLETDFWFKSQIECIWNMISSAYFAIRFFWLLRKLSTTNHESLSTPARIRLNIVSLYRRSCSTHKTALGHTHNTKAFTRGHNIHYPTFIYNKYNRGVFQFVVCAFVSCVRVFVCVCSRVYGSMCICLSCVLFTYTESSQV